MTLRKALALTFLIATLSAETGYAANAFNQLALQKIELENKFGILRLECFPFSKNIGSMADQANLVANCLVGVETLKSALKEIPKADIQTVGIDSRTYRTSGFHTVIIAWDINKDELVRFLQPSAEPQNQFMDKILALKEQVQKQFGEKDIYCSQRISNDQCLTGYQTLALSLGSDPKKNTRWYKIVIGPADFHDEDPHTLTLHYGSSAQEMNQALFDTNPDKSWSARKRVYDDIEEKYGEAFHRKLQLPNFFCDTDLAPEECMKGATNLYVAGMDDAMRGKLWGEVLINKSNSWITNDFDAHIRYDLSPPKIIELSAEKPSKETAQANSVLAEKLETQTKGNSSGLRAVCDLNSLLSEHCVKGFKTFIDFIKSHRDYRAGSSWTELMFVDGRQLGRVNFALNSSVRQSYIYIDANSTIEEMTDHLMNFINKGKGSSR